MEDRYIKDPTFYNQGETTVYSCQDFYIACTPIHCTFCTKWRLHCGNKIYTYILKIFIDNRCKLIHPKSKFLEVTSIHFKENGALELITDWFCMVHVESSMCRRDARSYRNEVHKAFVQLDSWRPAPLYNLRRNEVLFAYLWSSMSLCKFICDILCLCTYKITDVAFNEFNFSHPLYSIHLI